MSDDPCARLQAIWHQEIPISKAMAIEVVSFANDELVIQAELGPNINVHGTAFAGSLYAICALCGWGMTHLQLEQRGLSGSIVIADGQISYARPVKQTIVARCAFADQQAALARLSETGKTRFQLQTIVQAAGEVAATFAGTYAVKLNA